MPKFPFKLVTALALAGVSLGELSPLPAQEPAGEATISDAPAEPITEAEDLPIPGEAGETDDSSLSTYSAGSPSLAMGGYGPGYGAAGFPAMPYGGVPTSSKYWYGFRTAGPDWQRPIRRPLYRVPVQYARYWPSSYYTGVYDPRARYSQPLPMVYMPTDTTQLGFYHQRVPTWLPRPNAIPGPPWPPNWHYSIPAGGYGAYGDLGLYGGYGGYAIGGVDHYGTGPIVDSTAPAVIHPEEDSLPVETVDPPIAPGPAPELE